MIAIYDRKTFIVQTTDFTLYFKQEVPVTPSNSPQNKKRTEIRLDMTLATISIRSKIKNGTCLGRVWCQRNRVRLHMSPLSFACRGFFPAYSEAVCLVRCLGRSQLVSSLSSLVNKLFGVFLVGYKL